ncbi:hypothetical protein ACFX5Q_08205 [Mesorhizobium sp. IMUNJ 23033]|uniref:hypothetical protein n=1 Tax=Mesorhizobium sp. IMUNJ 23033 TaxID=3378039 RepID=UPI00384E4EB3
MFGHMMATAKEPAAQRLVIVLGIVMEIRLLFTADFTRQTHEQSAPDGRCSGNVSPTRQWIPLTPTSLPGVVFRLPFRGGFGRFESL